tara:strand:- start:1254 stop:3347 length:2094 start_codon:yes stop_codon:yes gene_type:complete
MEGEVSDEDEDEEKKIKEKCKLETDIQKVVHEIHLYLAKYNPSIDKWREGISRILNNYVPSFGDLEEKEEQKYKSKHPIINYLLNTKLFEDEGLGRKLLSEMYNAGYIRGKITGEAKGIIDNITIIKDKYKTIKTDKQIIELFELVPKGRKNPLQGTKSQILALHYLIDQPWYNTFKINLYNGTNKENWLHYSRLKPFFDSLGSRHEDDLNDRANIIKHAVVKNSNINKIILMDGHGRIISRVAEIFKDLLIDRRNINISILDIDCYSDMWHKNTTPLNTSNDFSSSEEDIFNVFKDPEFLSGNAFLYVNFSGLSKQGDKIVETISSLNAKLFKNIMISFSCFRSGIAPCNKTHIKLLHFGFSPLTYRSARGTLKQGDFVTLGLPILREQTDLYEEKELPPDKIKTIFRLGDNYGDLFPTIDPLEEIKKEVIKRSKLEEWELNPHISNPKNFNQITYQPTAPAPASASAPAASVEALGETVSPIASLDTVSSSMPKVEPKVDPELKREKSNDDSNPNKKQRTEGGKRKKKKKFTKKKFGGKKEKKKKFTKKKRGGAKRKREKSKSIDSIPSDPDLDSITKKKRNDAAKYIQGIIRARLKADKKRKFTKRRFGSHKRPSTHRESNRRFLDHQKYLSRIGDLDEYRANMRQHYFPERRINRHINPEYDYYGDMDDYNSNHLRDRLREISMDDLYDDLIG